MIVSLFVKAPIELSNYQVSNKDIEISFCQIQHEHTEIYGFIVRFLLDIIIRYLLIFSL